MDIRTGIGHDTHRVTAGRPLILGGVAFESDVGLEGHSDADCLLHALCDALLGAVGAGDIGEHFPDNDPRYRGAASSIFVTRAHEIVRERGYTLSNVDCIVFAERPRLGERKRAICESIERILGLPAGRVGVKAKSGEGVGSIGRGEAIAALVTVLVTKELPA